MEKLSDALTARNRLLQELVNIEDVETGQSLWRAAIRYNQRDKMERTGRLEIEASPLPRAAIGEDRREIGW